MTQDFLEYPKMVEDAMRGVVRGALTVAVENGLPGLHHFYITFRTTDPGVTVTDQLLTQYPEEMTIVLENQFWDLQVDDDRFSVTLSFGGSPTNLIIPYAAITSFVDPSVKFGLQFDTAEGEKGETASSPGPTETDNPDGPKTEPQHDVADLPAGDGQVVALDNFRKK